MARTWYRVWFLCLIVALGTDGVVLGAGAPPASENIALKILYVGTRGSEREKDFLSFLKNHFREVGSADINKFSEDQAKNFDVILFDFDGDSSRQEKLRLSDDYKRATVTIGVYGAIMCDNLRLKCGYT